jgi:uncharacterized protein YaaN involved in tellurite resistance
MERGIFDIESIKKANQTLIATLNDSMQIAEEGKKARQAALTELQKSEQALKEAILAVKAHREGGVAGSTPPAGELAENKEG